MIVYSLLVLTIYGAALAQVGDKLQVVSFAGGLLWALIVSHELAGLESQFQPVRPSRVASRAFCSRRSTARWCFLPRRRPTWLFLLMVELVTVPLFFVFFLSGAELPPTTPGDPAAAVGRYDRRGGGRYAAVHHGD
ncbi:MAG: hypothetical protein ACLTSX_11400 [Collinsella sp.]